LNMSDPCYNFGQTLHQSILSSILSGYSGSSLQQSCESNLCRVVNGSSSLSSCNYGDSTATNVCNNASATTVAPAPPTAAPVVYDIVVTLRLSGANWSSVLSNPTAKAELVTSLTDDLSVLLGVPAAYIVILSLTVGSLIVQFAVIQGSGKSIAQLSTSVNSATTSTSWLTSTSAVYATVGTDTLTVTGVTVTQTAAPTTPTPGTSGPVGAAPFTTVFAAVAVAAAASLLL